MQRSNSSGSIETRLIWSFPALFSATYFAKVRYAKSGMALCGYSVANSRQSGHEPQPDAAAGTHRPAREKAAWFLPIRQAFSWPALLADQTGDGENFMRDICR